MAVLAAATSAVADAAAQQVADTAFFAVIAAPAYGDAEGPVVGIDEAHNNFHTAEGRYLAFATLLRRDGFVVRSLTRSFAPNRLAGIDILVIANALSERNQAVGWSLPTPSAFSEREIVAVRDWVSGGGALLLIADHMPFPGAAADLAAVFGVRFMNGFAYENERRPSVPMVFRRSDNSLRGHSITLGRHAGETVDSVASFTGQAFQPGSMAQSIMVLRSRAISINPDTAWQFSPGTPQVEVGGWSQGAVLSFGQGRVAVFGEAAMFSAQVRGPSRQPMGMNSPLARGNQQFLLNVMHWLSGLLDSP